MSVSLLVAMDLNNGIGIDKKLPWRLPADLKYFRRLTLGHTILMGRKTYESIGKPLDRRRNVVLTRNPGFAAEGCEIVGSVDEALQRYSKEDELFVIGGGEIFDMTMPYADKLYITLIEHEFQVDTYFPEVDDTVWQLVSREPGVKDENNPYNYAYLVYERIQGTA